VTIVKTSEKEGKLGGMLPSSSHSGKKGALKIQNGIRKM
jgi:hypothetical protein